MDADAVIPYKREEKFVRYEPKTTKVFVTLQDGRERKITLKVYKGSAEEDIEHFFEAFEEFQKEMKRVGLWNDKFDINQEVPELFQHFDAIMQGTAQTDWYEIIGGTTSARVTWRDFKRLVAAYMMKKILKREPWQQQTSYMEQRMKPEGMSLKTWWKRFQSLNRYLRYMMDRKGMEEISGGKVTDFASLWNYGSFNEFQMKHILVNKVPRQWKEEFDSSAKTMESPLNELVEYFEKAEEREEKRIRGQRLRERRRYEGSIRGAQRMQSPRTYDRHFTSRGGYRYNTSRGGVNYQQQGRGGNYSTSRGGNYYAQQQQQVRSYSQAGPNVSNYVNQNYSRPQEAGRGFGRGFTPRGRNNNYYGQRQASRPPRQNEVHWQDESYYDRQANTGQEQEYQEPEVYYQEQEHQQVEEYEEEADDDVEELVNEWDEQLWLSSEGSHDYAEGDEVDPELDEGV